MASTIHVGLKFENIVTPYPKNEGVQLYSSYADYTRFIPKLKDFKSE
jgi:hypothetical protein